jgi:carbon storage regulator
MLVLSRKRNEKLLIGHDVKITVVEILPDRVRLGIEAPEQVSVVRAELAKNWHGRKKAGENGVERPPA